MARSNTPKDAPSARIGAITINQPKRINQQAIQPTAIKPPAFGNFIEISDVLTASFTLAAHGAAADADQIHVSVTSYDVNDRRLLGGVEWAIYEGSEAVTNIIPFGSAVDSDNYTFMGPYVSLLDDTSAINDGNMINAEYFIRNQTAGAKDIVVLVAARWIKNQGATGDTNDATS